MPDTYISQFSGEEIDSALRAAQMISGASTPAELREKLEIRGDTIPVSAGDSTLISEALTKIPTTSGGGVNPNLLDNWYFGRPVNQRNGYYIPAGVKYNTLSWTEAGTTDKAYPVIGYIGQDPLITVNGTNYIVGKSVQVPGYCTTGYTVDRWIQSFDGTLTSTLTNDGIKIVAGNDGTYKNFEQILTDVPTNTTLTLSFLVDNYTSISQIYTGFSGSQFDIQDNLISLTFKTGSSISGTKSVGIQMRIGKTATIKAAKFELGDTQTLAHKENGVWVLNEIPDFGEQLARCQRYCVAFQQYDTFFPTDTTDFIVELPCPMRTSPAIINPGNITNVNSPTMAWYNAGSNQLRIRSTTTHNNAKAVCSGLVLFSADL